MKQKEFDKLVHIVYNESMQMQQAIEMIAVSENSTKRERYCKKWNLTYTQFVEAFTKIKGELMNYPVQMCCMEHIILSSPFKKKKFLQLFGKVVNEFRELFKKSQKHETQQTAATEMEKLLKTLKEEKTGEEKKTPPSLPNDQM